VTQSSPQAGTGDELITALVDEGLGNSSYLVDLGEGRALAIDPSRDLRLIDSATARAGLSITAVAETHLHADFVSGATRLAASRAMTERQRR
jgi:glyoxylase-like metal-dependent hydrolase (beta-lactamase superfamily II)